MFQMSSDSCKQVLFCLRPINAAHSAAAALNVVIVPSCWCSSVNRMAANSIAQLHLNAYLYMLRQCIHMVMSFVVAADNVFRLLHTRVAILFSEQLQKDLASLKQGKPADVSLAAKWAPTPGGKLYYLC